MRKIIVSILIIGMLLSATPISIGRKAAVYGNILYVGGSGPGNYSSIQSAINVASDGDTIYVFDDSSPYYENLVVIKSINLIGEDRYTTVVNGGGSGDVIYISADLVNISGFTIQNSGNISTNSGIKIYSNYNKISDNNLNSNKYGISLENCHGNIISFNNISDNEINAGFRMSYSNNNIISNNVISSNYYGGINAYNSNNNLITGNNITNNTNNGGIILGLSSNNIISGNFIGYNHFTGISISGGGHNTISNNEIIFNEWGIVISSNNNTVDNNTVSNNDYGINLQQSASYNTINNNNISYSNNVAVGIWLYSDGNTVSGNIITSSDIGVQIADSDDNTISGNIITNDREGLHIASDSSNNIILANIIRNNTGGIFLPAEPSQSNNNQFYHNNLYDNGLNAFDMCDNIWDSDYPSGGNYWDDYTGKDANHDGIGDTPYNISGGNNKDHYPLITPYCEAPPYPPMISGPTSGKPGISYTYNVSSRDPDDDNVYYYVDWGDGTNTSWLGPYESGAQANAIHSWGQKGTYMVKVKAKDIHNTESNWTTLPVTMPLDLPGSHQSSPTPQTQPSTQQSTTTGSTTTSK